MNSLTLLLGFFAFLLFGYATYGRWLYKNTLSENNNSENNTQNFAAAFLEQIGSSSILFLIPAISISLFWGWVPALIWLIIAHIIGSLTYQVNHYKEKQNTITSSRFPENLFHGCSAKLRPIIIQLLQFSLIFLIAICINFAIEISTKNAGIFFTLFMLLPAYSLTNNAMNPFNSSPLNKATSSIGVFFCLAIAIFLPTKLGIFIHGSWQPLAELAPWLIINDKSILTVLFVVGISLLSKRPQHHIKIACFSGSLISLLFILLLCALFLMQPQLDAPINTSENNAPLFLQLFLLLFFPGIIAVFQIVFNSVPSFNSNLSFNKKKATNHHTQFLAQQAGSLFDTLFAALLISLLAASIGLGAWTTHYTNWVSSSNMLHHFSLGSQSLTEALAALSIPKDIANSFISLSFSLLIISISSKLLFNAKHLLPEKNSSPITNLLPDTNSLSETNNQHGKCLILALSYGLSLTILWHGLTLNIWLLFGILSWLLLTLFLLDLNLNLLKQKQRQDTLIFTSGFILLVGIFQSLVQTIIWYLNQQWFSAISSGVILLLGCPLLIHYVLQLLPELRKTEEINIFEQK